MRRTARTTFAASVLPLLLLLAAQGGSCGGGRAGGDNLNRAGAARRPTPAPGAAAAGATPSPAGSNAGGVSTAAEGGGAGGGTVNGNSGGNTGGNSDGGATMGEAQKRHVADGTWGGTGVRLEVKGGSAEVEFDCARGRVGEFSLDAEGRFSAPGTLVKERGGPARVGEEPESAPATYAGRVTGETMTLRVSVKGNDDLDYTLRRGSGGLLRKCL